MSTDFACPDEDVLLAIQDGKQIPADLQTHLDECQVCQRKLTELKAAIRSLQEVASAVTVIDAPQATLDRGLGSQLGTVQDDDRAVADDREGSSGDADSLAEKTRPGRFELIRMLGKGAFGEVHLAHDPHLDRNVAIKVAQQGMLIGVSQVNRFQREAQAAAQLRHPNIIPVYDVGQSGTTNYIIYEFVEGQTLRTVLAFRQKLDQREAATLVAKLASALHYAHSKGIVHRDIKPENILIDRHGEPHIADFGLAYRDETETLRTREGILMGTPAYMSPEQASGRGHDVDARADIWSLGVLFQELLTSHRPFEGPLNSLLSSIQNAEPRPIQDPSVSKDLAAICRTCLAKNSLARYQTSQELSEDLHRWLRGEPVKVRPVGPAGRAWRWAQRSPLLASLVAAVFVTLFAGVCASSFFAVVAHQKATLASREQRERALAQIDGLRTAAPESVPLILDNLQPHRDAVLPRLHELLERPDLTPAEQVRLWLAVVALSTKTDHRLLGELREDMTAAPATEFLMLRGLLEPFSAALSSELWMQALNDEAASAPARFRAACALALYDPTAAYWDNVAGDVADQLLVQERSETATWADAVGPVREVLLPHLRAAFDRGAGSEESYRAALYLGQLYSDRSDLLVELVLGAEPRQLRALLPNLPTDAATEASFSRVISLGTSSSGTESQVLKQANATVALLYLGRTDLAWPLLRQTPDKWLRTSLVHRVGPAGIDPEIIIQSLFEVDDPFVASALVLSLGEFPSDVLSGKRRAAISPQLLRLYREHPHPGVHSAVDWLLRKWGFSREVHDVDESMTSREPRSNRRWYVNHQGQTLAVFPGPVTFDMGSPVSEAERGAFEQQHQQQIPRSFAISTKEITNAQFREFQEPKYDATAARYSPDPECPVINLSWYDAVKYCRWLSEREEIPEDQMCFPPIAEIGPGMPESKINLDRSGYRLATSAEWEYACRAGAATSRHYGDAESMLNRYAWYIANSQNRTWPVGLLKPNAFGLFDVHANASEWCQNLFRGGATDIVGQDLAVDSAGASEGSEFELRGGTFLHPPAVTRAAWRDFQLGDYQGYEFGFRVARTYNGEGR